MASKRMFTMKIVDSDAFLDMPLSTQCLYFHLNMRADDDGFIDNPKRVMKIVGASQDDLKLLAAKRFILAFESGVMVIKHWRMHNTLSQSRYHATQYVDEKSMLKLKENGSYSLENGTEIDDEKLIEMSKRQCRRTKDEQKTNADIDLDIDKELDLIKYIVEYLNQTCGTRYKHSTVNTQKHIRARLKDGYVFEDFKTVIDKKAKEWKCTDMEKYLCPDTLFGSKFEKYLNQNISGGGTSGGSSKNSYMKHDYDFGALEKELGI